MIIAETVFIFYSDSYPWRYVESMIIGGTVFIFCRIPIPRGMQKVIL